MVDMYIVQEYEIFNSAYSCERQCFQFSQISNSFSNRLIPGFALEKLFFPQTQFYLLHVRLEASPGFFAVGGASRLSQVILWPSFRVGEIFDFGFDAFVSFTDVFTPLFHLKNKIDASFD